MTHLFNLKFKYYAVGENVKNGCLFTWPLRIYCIISTRLFSTLKVCVKYVSIHVNCITQVYERAIQSLLCLLLTCILLWSTMYIRLACPLGIKLPSSGLEASTLSSKQPSGPFSLSLHHSPQCPQFATRLSSHDFSTRTSELLNQAFQRGVNASMRSQYSLFSNRWSECPCQSSLINTDKPLQCVNLNSQALLHILKCIQRWRFLSRQLKKYQPPSCCLKSS